MPLRLAALAAALVVILGAAASVPPSRTVEGPPLGFTGGFGEPTCVECHIGNEPNAFGGRVAVEGLPEAFEAGTEYVLTVVLEAEETEVAGFELSARYAGGRLWGVSAGELRAADLRVTVRDSSNISYAHHSREGFLSGKLNHLICDGFRFTKVQGDGSIRHQRRHCLAVV